MQNVQKHVQLVQTINNVFHAEQATRSNLESVKRYAEMVSDFLRLAMITTQSQMMDVLIDAKLKNNGLVREVLLILRTLV